MVYTGYNIVMQTHRILNLVLFTYFIHGPILAMPAQLHRNAWHRRMPWSADPDHGKSMQTSIYPECSPRDAWNGTKSKGVRTARTPTTGARSLNPSGVFVRRAATRKYR